MSSTAVLQPPTTSASASAAAELINVTHRYGTHTALRNLSLTLRPGEVVALLGPNGAGKTTAVKLLLGLLQPSKGEVKVFGRSPSERATRQRIGAMLQVARVPETLAGRRISRPVPQLLSAPAADSADRRNSRPERHREAPSSKT